MIPVLLSLGAIYAFIPIIIIIILIIAARGTRGLDFFEVFGINTLLGFTRGIGRGAAVGKGISGGAGDYPANKKKPSTKQTEVGRRARGVGSVLFGDASEKLKGSGIKLKYVDANTGATHTITLNRAQKMFQGSLWKKNAVDELRILDTMTNDQIHALLQRWGYGPATSGMANRDALLAYTINHLSLSKVADYFDRYIAPNKSKGSQLPLNAPTGSVRMSLGEFAKRAPGMMVGGMATYYGARRRWTRGGKSLQKALSAMSVQDLNGLCNYYAITINPGMTRDEIILLASSRLTMNDVQSYLKSKQSV